MNRVFLSGRLSRDPEVRYSGDMAIAKFSLAVDRKVKKGEEKKADFINCTAFGSQAEFIEKYFRKGDGMNLEGRIQTGSYKNKDGFTVYTTDVIVDAVEFPLSNKTSNTNTSTSSKPNVQENTGFDVNEGFTSADDVDLPFN